MKDSILFKIPKIIFSALIVAFAAISLNAQIPNQISDKISDQITISRNFNLFTSQNLQGYLKPLFTSLEESFNSNIYSKSVYEDYWTIAVDLSVMGMFIPDDHKLFNAQRPEDFGDTKMTKTAEKRTGNIYDDKTDLNMQPTLYGGMSTAIFSAPQYHSDETDVCKTVTYVEGNNISFMSGLPVLQIIAGFPTRTQARIRFMTAPVQDKMLYYFGIMANQQLNTYLHIFENDPLMGFGVNLAYHRISRNPGVTVNSWAAGLNFSKGWDNGLGVYAGLQFEGINGHFTAVREPDSVNIDSPYEEIRYGKNLDFDINGFNSFRFLGGLSYRAGFFEVHADAAWASQPILTAGFTFWIASFGKPELKDEEKVERIKR